MPRARSGPDDNLRFGAELNSEIERHTTAAAPGRQTAAQ